MIFREEATEKCDIAAASRLLLSIFAWALFSSVVYLALSRYLPQSLLQVLLGREGLREVAFTFFVLAVLLCWAGWFYLSFKKVDFGQGHRSFIIALSIVSIALLGFVKEVHPQSWDFMCYYLAGRGMAEGINIYDPTAVSVFNAAYDHSLTYYTYTPLFAAVLGQFDSFSKDQIFHLLTFLNYFAVVFCAASFYLILLRYKFSGVLAATIMAFTFLINVSITRTLLFTQVNLWVLTFILLGFLYYSSHPWLSALFLVLAMNLKITPIILVSLMVLKRDWKWLMYFSGAQVLVMGLTSWKYGFDYWMYFISFVLQTRSSTAPTLMRNNSFDAFFIHTFQVLNITSAFWVQLLATAFKLLFLFVLLKLTWEGIKRGVFVDSGKESLLFNGLPLLLVLMLMSSPLVWPHHFVFVLPSLIAAFSLSRETKTFWLLTLIYFSWFWIPVFDLYPFSLHRFVCVFLYIYTVWLLLKEDQSKPTLLTRLNDGFKRIAEGLNLSSV